MLTSFLYQKGKPFETNLSRARLLEALHEKEAVLWVDLDNPNEFESETLVEIFNFHPLAVEDCISDVTTPKADDYEEYLFLVTHAIRIGENEKLTTVELNIFLGKNYVVTFHQDAVKSIDQVRETVQKKPEMLLGYGPDLLVHAVLDHLVDNYLPVLDTYDAKIDALEEEIFNRPSQDYLSRLMQIKRDIYNLRRIVSPERDTLYYLTRNPTPFIKPRHMIYFRDVHDHLFRVYNITEGYHETLSSILQAYFSYQSNKLNEIMKRMTVLATLTMPIVMIASIYGMNFRNMPELEWQYGYHFAMVSMISVSIVMLVWMKWKKWI